MDGKFSNQVAKLEPSFASFGGNSLPTSPRRVISKSTHDSPKTPTRQFSRKQAQRLPATLPPSKPVQPHMNRFHVSAADKDLFPRHWFIAFAKELCPDDPRSLRLVDATDEMLAISASHRAAIEKSGQTHRSNYIVWEDANKQMYFVKRTLNRDRAKREWVCIFPWSL